MILSNKKIWAVLFITITAAVTVLIFLVLKERETEIVYQDTSHTGEQIDQAQNELSLTDKESTDNSLSNFIPAGFRAVSIPVNYFGDYSVLKKGDRVDIISTYYKRDTGMLESEMIISAGEIIRVETGENQIEEDSLFLNDAIVPDNISASGNAIDIGNIIVITFFMTNDEALNSFTALERGMLFLAICPDN